MDTPCRSVGYGASKSQSEKKRKKEEGQPVAQRSWVGHAAHWRFEHVLAGGRNSNRLVAAERQRVASAPFPPMPDYLERFYWWAYLRPPAIRLFERQWLINAILFGNYARLRDAALDALGESLPGLTLQIACVYGDFSARLCDRTRTGSSRLDIVDVVPAQLENLRRKLPSAAPFRTLLMDAAALDLPRAAYDRAVLFFLLHEQPSEWRRRTLAEAMRVVRPGGRVVIVDYAKPRPWQPLRYALAPILARIEPFALDLWRAEVESFAPPAAAFRIGRRAFFGGLYQLIALERARG